MTEILTRFATWKMLKGEMFVHFQDMPVEVEGACRPNADGTYSIFLNTRHSVATQRAAFFHEVAHIYFKDHQSDLDADMIEAQRRLQHANDHERAA